MCPRRSLDTLTTTTGSSSYRTERPVCRHFDLGAFGKGLRTRDGVAAIGDAICPQPMKLMSPLCPGAQLCSLKTLAMDSASYAEDFGSLNETVKQSLSETVAKRVLST